MKKVRKQRKYFKNRNSQRVNEHTIRAMIRFLSKKNNLPYASVSSYYNGKFGLLKGY